MPDIDPRWAWERYRPNAEQPWNLQRAGHLLRRATFGPTWEQLQRAVNDGVDRTVDRLLAGEGDLGAFEAQTEPLARSIAAANNGQQLPAWWLYRMLYSPHPLREKMTLCWHNHFATSNTKVQNARLMLGMYQTLYTNALGRFDTMLQAISHDPAMMIWLDTFGSQRGQANENYARELMELFSLGIGNYTERDIREAARAFTGWELRGNEAFFNPDQHDDGEKTVLGQTGRFRSADIVRICLEQPACPRFIAGKLFRFLVSETITPTPELLAPLADDLRRNNFDIRRVVETILRSNLFYAQQSYRTRIKAPVDFVLTIVRGLEGRVGTTALATALESLGQNVFYPPSVKGWDGGPTWLNGQTLLFRQNLALALTSTTDNRFGRRTDPAALITRHLPANPSDEQIVDFFLRLFLQADVPAATRQRLIGYLAQARQQRPPIYWTADDVTNHRVRAVCHLVLTQPEFQLD